MRLVTPSMRRVTSLSLGLALLGTTVAASAQQQSEGPPPFSGPEADAVDGLPALKKLVEGGRLKLSLDETSATDRFYFGLVAYVRSAQAGTQSTEMAVWREGDKFLFWSWARDGKVSIPTCAVTDGLIVGCDLKNPGGVVLFEGGHPEVAFTAAPDMKGGEFLVRYHPTGRDAARLVFDAKAIIQSSFETMTSASYDEKNKSIKVTTKRARMEIKPEDDPKRPCAVRSLMITGQSQAVGFWLATDPIKPPPRVEKLTAANLEATGLAVRRLTVEDAEELGAFFKVPLPNFLADARHRQASQKIWSVMRPDQPPKSDAKKGPAKFEPVLPF